MEQYQLGPFVIQKNKNADEYTWARFYGYEWEGERQLDRLLGRGFVETDLDVLVLTSWKVRDDGHKDFESYADAEAYVKSLPNWDKTKYFLKMDDFGSAFLQNCDTGEFATKEEHELIMPNLGFVRQPVNNG